MFSVLVCRACCCGRASKHPGIDHAAQVDLLRLSVEKTETARMRIVDCLDVCSQSNVIVVRHRPLESSPRRGNEPGRRERSAMWFGGITTDALTATMCKWLSGGALRDQVPDSLRAHMFDGPAVRLGELDQDIECDASGDGSKAKGTPVFLR